MQQYKVLYNNNGSLITRKVSVSGDRIVSKINKDVHSFDHGESYLFPEITSSGTGHSHFSQREGEPIKAASEALAAISELSLYLSQNHPGIIPVFSLDELTIDSDTLLINSYVSLESCPFTLEEYFRFRHGLSASIETTDNWKHDGEAAALLFPQLLTQERDCNLSALYNFIKTGRHSSVCGSTTDEAGLYHAGENECFSQANYLARPLTDSTDLQVFEFTVPQQTKAMRFDPLTRPGSIILNAIEVLDDGSLYQLDPQKIITGSNELELSPLAEGLLLESCGNDPWITLDCALLDRASTIRVTLSNCETPG